MFPIKNAVPTRYPAVVTWALIAANCLVFFVQLGLGPREELRPHSRTLLRLAAGRFGFLVGRLFAVKHSVLGPVDPQLGQSPAASLLKVIEQKPVKEIDDQTLVLADVGRKAIAQLKDAARELLARRLPADQAQTLADKLSGGTWTHDYPIRPGEARELGLPISTEMPKEVLELMTLYPQPMRTQRAVEYLPAPRQRQPPATSIAELLTRKERLLSRLEEYPGPNERDEIERLLDKIDAELNAVDRPDRL